MGIITRVIGIVSGKGGVGKTTVAINLAATLARFDKDVLIVDANLTTSHVGLYLGMYYFPVTLDMLLAGRKIDVARAIYRHYLGFKILPLSISLEDVRKAKMKMFPSIIEKLKPFGKIVLIDSAPGFGKESIASIEASDELLIVANPDIACVNEIKKIVEISKKLRKKILGVVLNRVKFNPFELSKREIEIETGCKVIGIIPENDIFKKALFLKTPAVELDPRGEIAIRFSEICNKIFKTPKIYGPEGLFEIFVEHLKSFLLSSLSLIRRR